MTVRDITEILRELREDGDFKQHQIGKVLGVTQQYYSKYETGEYEIPVRHLIALSNFYDVSMDYLVGLTRFKPRFEELQVELAETDVSASDFLERLLKLGNYEKALIVEYLNWLESRKNSQGQQ